ncbi:MAG: SPASM domain-containing protein [Longicatena sp.]
MKNLNLLIKPASSLCNLECRYCFYKDVSKHRTKENTGIMEYRVVYHLIDKALSSVDCDGHITFAFQGGEPTLAGLSFYKTFCEYVDKKKQLQTIEYSIQTNTYVLDESWCIFFHSYNFLVGISLDGYKENHDYFRLSVNNTPTFKSVMKTIDLFRKHHVEFNVLTVLSNQLAKHPEKLYKFYQKEKIDNIQLIPCLAKLNKDKDEFSLSPRSFANFYKMLFDIWIKEFNNGHYRSISLFDNLILMLSDTPPKQCGMLGFCSMQYVIESDGNVYPCDFYVLDKYNGGNICETDLLKIVKSTPIQKFLKETEFTSELCSSCAFVSICHGNCKRMKNNYIENDYCGYQDFLSYAYPSLMNIVKARV